MEDLRRPLQGERSAGGTRFVTAAFLSRFFQYSFAIIFIWFGALKVFGLSPAYELITRTFSFFPPAAVNLGLGWWELVTGILFLFSPTVRAALVLMALQIPGTFLPLIVVPEMCFVKVPWVLTTNGEFIVKNLLLIGGGLLLYAFGSRKPDVEHPAE